MKSVLNPECKNPPKPQAATVMPALFPVVRIAIARDKCAKNRQVLISVNPPTDSEIKGAGITE
ncbi:hypothetical protein [Terracidiphilus sp.]|uniref:hypothetical protein n=1 Tax=Terracidiphilus sp. TaxID=1964191 RepID=UPI003C23D610